MKALVNWGIIGLGNVATEFAEAFKYTKNSNLLAISSKDQNKLNKFKKDFGAKDDFCFKNYDGLLNCKEIDIIYIALPNSLHYEWITKSIKKEKNILVEKPATVNLSELRNIESLLKKKQIFFAEGFMYRYHPQILKVIDLLKKNTIGKVLSMESFFGHKIFKSKKIFGIELNKFKKNNRLFNKDLGGGAILDLGCYPVSFGILIASLLSKNNLSDIKISNIKNKIGPTQVDIDSFAEINFNNSLKCIVGASFIQDLGKKTKIIGTKGEIILEDSWLPRNSSTITINASIKDIINIKCSKNIYQDEIENISNSIINNKKDSNFPGMTLKESLQNMLILDQWRGVREV